MLRAKSTTLELKSLGNGFWLLGLAIALAIVGTMTTETTVMGEEGAVDNPAAQADENYRNLDRADILANQGNPAAVADQDYRSLDRADMLANHAGPSPAADFGFRSLDRADMITDLRGAQ